MTDTEGSKPRNVSNATLTARAYAKLVQLKAKLAKMEAIEEARHGKYLDRVVKIEAELVEAQAAHDKHTGTTQDDAEPAHDQPSLEAGPTNVEGLPG